VGNTVSESLIAIVPGVDVVRISVRAAGEFAATLAEGLDRFGIGGIGGGVPGRRKKKPRVSNPLE
jgi:hypothetical protein